mmetsp:Transcript_5794/g.13208  ORF Transcript_5794/g.13208 Transcript_5794/m.13208 type:complete len:170 (+) Transcript_5794:148-657(+)|eukprot:CAMPEP_0172314202 /NCGR_PEP_ID=MMETSP1058-20130122/21939_1 /TAXON_ID=83371 /ORGANISM="Detonula confervacea, Strain CCMP 353" /LENGTH=169 /DNA_ID=CAMNT_0013028005 /DNA_START=122 /DNA_END=631 /DNA_ORIENTATION=-
MVLQGPERRREVEVAKQRLPAVKTRKKSASDAVKLAQEQLESAQRQLAAAENEEKKAESSLKEAYDRLEVVNNVTGESDAESAGSSIGKRKSVSLSPDYGNRKKVRADDDDEAVSSQSSVAPASDTTMGDDAATLLSRLGLKELGYRRSMKSTSAENRSMDCQTIEIDD